MSKREAICKVGKLLYDRGYVASNDGNISVRTGNNEILITPSGVSKGRMTPDMMVKTDLDGNVLGKSDRYPSSEIKMHLMVYKNRPDVNAVVHAHPVTATAFACCNKALDETFLPEMIIGFGKIPVTEFAMLSTDAVPESLKPFVQDYNAVLLANHGAITWSGDLWNAFDRMETLEHTAKIYLAMHQLGALPALTGHPLSKEECDTMIGLRGFYAKNAGKREED